VKVSAVETLPLGELPSRCLLRLHTDVGLVGLGETFLGASQVAAYLHDSPAPRLLGRDPSAIDGLRIGLQNDVGPRSTGVEGRGNSAVDLGYPERVTGLPVVEGGTIRPGPGPGLAVERLPDLARRPDALVRRSAS
jgi:L-alanine-DL-glutamate epimerase-like enolase superfamily enzyme